MSSRMAMFPLGTVLVPHAVLPLHVFEPRYRVLVFDCLQGDKEFGVVLIERGSEVGGEDQRFGVGTVARIGDATELADGRWLLLAVGTRRVEVVTWLPDDPYPIALVDERPDRPWPDPVLGAGGSHTGRTGRLSAAAGALASADRAVRRALALSAEVGEDVPSDDIELSPEPAIATWQLLAVAPIESLDKQRLLAVDDHVQRLHELAELAGDRAMLLAYRLNRE